MGFYKHIIRPILFKIDPEKIHHLVYSALKTGLAIPGVKSIVRSCHSVNDDRLKRTVLGIEFPNPVGLAAGFDKDAGLFEELSCLGFGFIEVGTVTPLPQPGNDKPRMFRLPEDSALINRMGFNNEGVVPMQTRLKKRRQGIIIGGNIGKNKITLNENAIFDYEVCFTNLFDYVDYFAVNVSSPNTPGLRSLQEKEPLMHILNRLQELNTELAHNSKSNKRKPVLLKIAPDLSDSQLDEIIEVVQATKIDGVIATNTTISRSGLKTDSDYVSSLGAGGLSGKPLTNRSTEVIRYLHSNSNGSFVIIGAGGIHSPEDALEKLKAGASLIQLYTGFIYEGPSLIKAINKRILAES
jgi:dihydroorotate dehydrogenase